MKKLEEYVISIPDFPEPGIIFRDITSILQDPDGLKLAIDSLLEMVKDVDFDVVVGAESRGFIFGTPVAYAMGKAFVPAKKPGKLPRETVSMEYALEYGTGTIELHRDSIKPGQKVVIIDDLIVPVPYSKAYSIETVSLGSLPGFLAGTKDFPISYATGVPKINPLDSAPTTTSKSTSFTIARRESIASLNPSGSCKIEVISRKIIPGSGKSGMLTT